MKILYYICLIAAALIPSKHALHMFQQNRYEVKRYITWIEDSIEGGAKRAMIPTVVILAVACACIHLETGAILLICTFIAAALAIILFLREKKQEYVKPLVYTGRVKRQIVVLAILYLVIQLILLHAYRRLNLWLMLAISYFGPWLLVFPMAWLTMPVENAVKQWYINDAKKKLESCTSLTKIGITGSYGKTSTKNVIQNVLSVRYNSLMTPASFNTPMGITITIRNDLKPIHQVFVCEMGADHVGDITELMNFVHPQIGIVTSIGPQHLSTFGSQENIIREKMQEIELLPKDGLGILNYDNDFIRNYKVQNPVKLVTCAIHHEADYMAKDIHYETGRTHFTLVHGEEQVSFETKLLGELNILNILFAIACARTLNVPWNLIQRAVKEMKQVEHRLEMKEYNGRHFLDDAFNANPSGAAMALEVLSEMPGRRFIITPGMIELGKEQDRINREFGAKMKDHADEVILVGAVQTAPIKEGLELSGFDMEHVHVFDTEREALNFVYQNAGRNDVTLLENDLPDAFNH